MRASLEAEASALRGQLDDALAEGVELRAKISEAEAEAEARVAAKEKECTSWKAKWKSQGVTTAELQTRLEEAERRAMSDAAAHASSLASAESKLGEESALSLSLSLSLSLLLALPSPSSPSSPSPSSSRSPSTGAGAARVGSARGAAVLHDGARAGEARRGGWPAALSAQEPARDAQGVAQGA